MSGPPPDLPTHLELLGSLFAGDVERFAASAGEPSSARAFAGFVVHHQIAIQLLRQAELGGFVDDLPEALVARLQRRRSMQRERVARLLTLLEPIHRRLTERGLDSLLLKGPTLARRLHGEIDARESADLDLLVRRPDIVAACAALADSGLRPRRRRAWVVPWVVPFVHAIDYDSAQGSVDLHWTLDRHPSLRLDSAWIWRQRRVESLGAVQVPAASDGVEILAACLAVVRDGERGRLKLKTLFDLRCWMDRPEVWPALFEAARAQRAERPCRRALALAVAAFGSPGSPACAPAARARGSVASGTAGILPWLLTGRPSWRARRWSFSSWEGSTTANAAWWLLSLPARLAVHGRQRATSGRSPSRGLR